MMHLFMIKAGEKEPEEPEHEKPINVGGAQSVFTRNLPDRLQYVALGHLHRLIRMDEEFFPVIYSGSPIQYSFPEAGQDKHVVLIEVEPGKAASYTPVKLSSGKQLAREKFEKVDDALKWLSENQEKIVQVTIRTENFISAEDRTRILQAHEAVIGPIPELTGDSAKTNAGKVIDLDKSREELFKDFFRFRKGQEPDKAIMDLFREIVVGGDK